MKSWKTYILASTLTLTSATLLANEIDGVVTVVNNGVILKSDITQLKKTVALNTEASKLPPDSILNKQILEQLIMEELQLQEANKFNIRIDDSRLDQAITAIAKDRKISVNQLQKTLSSQGISWSAYRDQIRKEMTIAEIRNAMVRNRINILPQEVNSLVEQLKQQNQSNVQYELAHIQLEVPEDADKAERDQVLATANQLVNELRNGADFASLAIANSSGSKALNGGNWGWLRVEEMPTLFADQIGSKGKGAIIGPFRSGVGYHILKIQDAKGLQNVEVTEVNARHILIKPTMILNDTQAKNKLLQLSQEIKSGKKTFEQVAKEYSLDNLSAAKGGELGWQTTDIYVPEFKRTLDTLAKGQLSQPFKTSHGWHVVEVLGRRTADRTETAMENHAYRILLNRKFNEEAAAWLQELRAGAYIENVQSAVND